ncbi:trypsin-like serine protease [Streptomyces sp. NPDC056503]|uniref:trypsin-like serine protease n=1 Tax=Streptomyces sp. NPDC056503 TaxID=3345842 RepID=UPI0036A54875
MKIRVFNALGAAAGVAALCGTAAVVPQTPAVPPLALVASQSSAAPFAVEESAYPGASQILQEQGITLKRGNGGLLLTACDKAWDVMVESRVAGGRNFCFDALRPNGYLALEISDAFGIWTKDVAIQAKLTSEGKTTTVDVAKDSVKPVGESDIPSGRKPAVLAELRIVSGPAAPLTPLPELGFVGTADIGDAKRSCTAVLVDADWVLTAKSCFADPSTESGEVAAGAPKEKTTVTFGSQTGDVVDLVPRTDRDVVLARLAKPLVGIAPVEVSATGVVAGEEVTVAGYGRTRTEWRPFTNHRASFTVDAPAAAGFDLGVKSPADAPVCQGDAGGPVLRTVNGKQVLVGLVSRAFQAGCLDSAETRTGAYGAGTEGLGDWIDLYRAQAPGWKTSAVVQSGTGVYQATRTAHGSWTGFTDVQGKAGDLGGIRGAAVAGVGGDTHVLAISSSGGLFHTIRKQDGTWGRFGDVFSVANALGNLTQVSAVSIGHDLHVVAVADGRAFHTFRNATGHWTPFRDVSGSAVTHVTAAATASVKGELHVGLVSGGKPYHSIRQSSGTWTSWGYVADAAGGTGPVGSISMAGAGDEMHVVVATDNGTRQYHALRKSSGSWESFADLKDVLGTVTAKSVGVAGVDGETQVSVTTADGKVLHTVRRADRTWSAPVAVPLRGLPAAAGGVALTTTFSS